MTTIIVMRTLKAIYLASDSQVTLGNLRMADDFDKIQLLGTNLIASCGSVGLTQKITSRAYKNLKAGFIENENYFGEPSVGDFAREISNLNFYMPLEFKEFKSAGFLLAGLEGKELKGYSLGDDGSLLPINSFCADGSGSQIALGYLAENFDPNLDLEEGANVIGKAVFGASKQDIYTSSRVKIFALTPDSQIKFWTLKEETVKEPKKEK